MFDVWFMMFDCLLDSTSDIINQTSDIFRMTMQKYHIANPLVKHSALNFQSFRHFFLNPEVLASKRFGVFRNPPFPSSILNTQLFFESLSECGETSLLYIIIFKLLYIVESIFPPSFRFEFNWVLRIWGLKMGKMWKSALFLMGKMWNLHPFMVGIMWKTAIWEIGCR